MRFAIFMTMLLSWFLAMTVQAADPPPTLPDPATEAGSSSIIEHDSADLELPDKTPKLGLKLPKEPERDPQTAKVVIGQNTVFSFEASRAGRSPQTRARSTNRILREIIEQKKISNTRVESLGGVSVIYINDRPVAQLTERDAAAAGDSSTEIYAQRIAAQMEDALHREWRRTAVAGTIFNISLGVLFTVLAFVLWRRTWRLSDHASQWLKTHPNRLPPLKLRSAELLNRAAVHSLLTLGAILARWVILIAIFYAWLIAIFSLLGRSRGLTDPLTASLLTPVTTLSSRIGAAVPSVLIVLLALLPFLLLLRVVRIYFQDVGRGNINSRWLTKDLAQPAGRLAEIAIIMAALILVAPVITGNPYGAAPVLGLLILMAVVLAAVPMLASVAVGAFTLFGRRLAVGDWIDFGARSGRIANMGLLDITVRDREGMEIRLPHLARLWQPVHLQGRHGQKRRITAPFVIERKLLTPTFAEKLEKALYAAGSNPHVRLLEVGATHATVEISVTSATRDARSHILWIALNQSTEAETGIPVQTLERSTPQSKPQMPADPKPKSKSKAPEEKTGGNK